MKAAYVVVGPESSGNRLLAALLIRAGCFGEAAMRQPWDDLPTHETPVVVIRSYPHGNEWPDLRDIHRTLRDRSYCVRVVVAARDPHCVVASQVRRQNHPEPLALANLQRAYRLIFTQLAELNAWFTLVPLEALVLHPAQATRRLLESLELPVDNLGGEFTVEGVAHEDIHDSNAAHYDDA